MELELNSAIWWRFVRRFCPLALDSELREEMGRRGRRLVEDRLSYEIIARRFVELGRSDRP